MKYFTPEEIAEILQVSTRTVYRAIDSGELRGVKIGRLWRVSKDSLDKYLAERESA